MADRLFGVDAPGCRKLTGEMIFKASGNAASIDVDRLRAKMAGPPAKFVPAKRLKKTWGDFRRLQVRQLFRLALEALSWWTLGILETKPKGTIAIVDDFLNQLPGGAQQRNASALLRAMLPSDTGPTELIGRIQSAMNPPVPTADRIQTVVTLAHESELLGTH
jgi:hypothetical protein